MDLHLERSDKINAAKHGEVQWKVGFQTGEIFPLKNRGLANESKRCTNYVAP